MLMTETPASIDNDVMDAVAEVANMVVGSAKTSFEEVIGPIGMSIPTVIYGRNFVVHSASEIPVTCMSFTVCDLTLRVSMSLAPSTARCDARRVAHYMLQPA
jgi:chemotaxis protein CheX